jgi:Asp-tRNA(Asn)/Glu-tRNA(Gln) amidotransferase A subunit family amidase
VNFVLARTVADTALLLDICAGPDPYDRTCLPEPAINYRHAVDSLDVSGLRVAYSSCFGIGPIDTAVGEVVEKALDVLIRTASLEMVDVELSLPIFFDTYTKIEGVDRWVDLPEGLWPERKADMELDCPNLPLCIPIVD